MIYRQWNEYVHQTHFTTSYFCCHKYSSSTLSDLRLVTRYIWYTSYFQSSTRIALEHDVWISVFSSFLVSWPFFHAPKHVHRRSRAALSTCLPRSPLDGPVQWALNRPWLFFFEPSYVFRSIVDLAEGVASFTIKTSSSKTTRRLYPGSINWGAFSYCWIHNYQNRREGTLSMHTFIIRARLVIVLTAFDIDVNWRTMWVPSVMLFGLHSTSA